MPMLASLEEAPLEDPGLVYEPKYDGIRVVAEVEGGGKVRLWSRLGNEKTSQFPEIGGALSAWAQRRKDPVVLDGEIVALNASGRPTGFQQLQGRMHLRSGPQRLTDASSAGHPVAYIVFDLLGEGSRDLRDRPLTERRVALERVFGTVRSAVLRISEQVRGDGRTLYRRALDEGWEGLIAKRAESRYHSGKRTPDWRKLKVVYEQEFVVGGWTEPRESRTHFGALLLGVYDSGSGAAATGLSARESAGRQRGRSRASDSAKAGDANDSPRALVYVGHTGTGFDERELARVMRLMAPLETAHCPFAVRPRTNERPHWVQPKLVAQIKFTEWTADGNLRHPVYLGLRDDKRPEDVRRETRPRYHASTSSRLGAFEKRPPSADGANPHSAPVYAPSPPREFRATPAGAEHRSAPGRQTGQAPAVVRPATRSDGAARRDRDDGRANRKSPPAGPVTRRVGIPPEPSRGIATAAVVTKPVSYDPALLVDQLRALEDGRRDGAILLPDGDQLAVTNLHKVFWPALKLTKGDLFRYYAAAAPYILPALADRPLVMKRYPNGIAAKPFYQHRIEGAPPGVRVEAMPNGDGDGRPQLVGGTLKTLLYCTQLAAISQDPWFSRIRSVFDADHAALDLDPAEGTSFERVLDVARWIRDELQRLGAEGVPKTSGADGLHIYIPLPPGTPYEAGLLYCQIIATVVAQKHPKVATVERSVRRRGTRVYIDCLQNILGKTLASAYSARASDYAGVSTPLTWKEVEDGIHREDFTITTMPARLGVVGDLWAALRNSKGVELEEVRRYESLGLGP
jgi:bifunctional non-homologous end joining protein LigD